MTEKEQLARALMQAYLGSDYEKEPLSDADLILRDSVEKSLKERGFLIVTSNEVDALKAQVNCLREALKVLDRNSKAREALEAYEQSKPKPEPVAYRFPYAHSINVDGEVVYQYSHRKDDFGKWYKAEPLYTTPPTREPLSEDKLDELINSCSVRYNQDVYVFDNSYDLIQFARAIEQAHGIGVTMTATKRGIPCPKCNREKV